MEYNYEKELCSVPACQKYSLGIEEAAEYYSIGRTKLRQIVADHPNGDFYIEVGKKILLKRKQFEAFLDNVNCL